MVESAQIVDATVEFVMLVVVSLYFLLIMNKIKLRSNQESKCRTFWVGTACFLRFAMSFYDCFVPINEITHQYWRLYLSYFIGVMFMLIYLTLVFRVIGSWTLFSLIRMQDQPKTMRDIVAQSQDEHVLQQAKKLNKLSH